MVSVSLKVRRLKESIEKDSLLKHVIVDTDFRKPELDIIIAKWILEGSQVDFRSVYRNLTLQQLYFSCGAVYYA